MSVVSEYCSWIERNHKQISRKEEYRLGKLSQQGNKKAINALVTANLKLAVKGAFKFSGYVNGKTITIEDFVQQGNIGLIKAAEKYNPDMSKFSVYAFWWINSYIQAFALANTSVVKMGTVIAERKLFFKYGKFVSEIMSFNDQTERDAARKRFAKKYSIDIKYIYRFEKRISNTDYSMDKVLSDSKGDGDGNETLHNFVESNCITEKVVQYNQIKMAVKRLIGAANLTDREKHIISSRFMSNEPTNQRTLGQNLGISHQRIQQLEKKILNKLKLTYEEKSLDFAEI